MAPEHRVHASRVRHRFRIGRMPRRRFGSPSGYCGVSRPNVENGAPEGVAAAVVEFMVGPLCEEPERVGGPLLRELAGYHSSRRGPYRIVYRIVAEDHIVRVVRIEHRSDVYRDR